MASGGRRGLAGLNAYERHKKFVHDYLTFYGGKLPSREPGDATVKTDWDSVKEHHRFLRSEEDDKELTWEVKLARKYYAKLFKEYCLADLSRYKESKIGMRWRTEKEVVSGKGQFVCGNKQCGNRQRLGSYEVREQQRTAALRYSMENGFLEINRGYASLQVNFGYKEAGEHKQALVKLRVCPECADKLNYNRKKAYRRTDRSDSQVGEGANEGTTRAKRQRDASPGDDTARRIEEMPRRKRENGKAAVASDDEQEERRRESAREEGNVWAQQKPSQAEATQEDEFDKYFHDMFL